MCAYLKKTKHWSNSLYKNWFLALENQPQIVNHNNKIGLDTGTESFQAEQIKAVNY